MSFYIDPDIVEALNEFDLVEYVARHYTPMKKQGKEWVGLCPNHPERSPSFFVNARNELTAIDKAIHLAEYYRENAKRVYEEILGEKGISKQVNKEEQKKRALDLHKEGKSYAEIATIIFGDEKQKGTIHRWLKTLNIE